MADRSYGDACGVARALDVIGERWALLVIRELLLGPKRFGDLHHGLGGMSQNVLAQRLRELEAAGVVERRRLGPPAGAWVYSLTERGAALEPVLVELGRWGRARPVAPGAPMSLDAFALALRTTYGGGATGVRAVLAADGDAIVVEPRGGALAAARGARADADVAAWADVATLRELAFGTLRVRDAVAAGDLRVEGDADALQRLFDAIAPRAA
jgi:DNA-binding HxlR family transcriptional regulator